MKHFMGNESAESAASSLTSIIEAVKSMEKARPSAQEQQRPADRPELAAVKDAERAVRDVACWRCFIRVNHRDRDAFIRSLKQAFDVPELTTDLEAQLLLSHRKSVGKVTDTFLSNGQRESAARGCPRPRRKRLGLVVTFDVASESDPKVVPGGHRCREHHRRRRLIHNAVGRDVRLGQPALCAFLLDALVYACITHWRSGSSSSL